MSFLLGMTVALGIGVSAICSHAVETPDIANPEEIAEHLSVVPEDDWISDSEARLSLAEVLSYRQNSWDEAAREMKFLLGTIPLDQTTLARLGDIAANIGHTKTACTLYDRALALRGATPELEIRYADRMSEWGDFYAAERIYRVYLKKNPESSETLNKLAKLLTSSERYEEAEGIHHQLTREKPDSAGALAELAKVKMREKDFTGALALVGRSIALAPDDPGMLNLKASILREARRFAEARNAYLLLSEHRAFMSEAYAGIARTYIDEGAIDSARPYAEKALALVPDDLEARLFKEWGRLMDEGHFRDLLAEYSSPRQLEQLGALYASRGYSEKAANCYKTALTHDPEYFPARLGLADMLASQHRYEQAIEAYKKLAADFPGNSKIRIGLARILGWSKHYDESIALYDNISRQNPADPVPTREKARTAVWSKKMDKAAEYYDTLLLPPVDRAVVLKLNLLADRDATGAIKEIAKTAHTSHENDAPYLHYEIVADALTRGKITDPAQRIELEQLLNSQLSYYRIQKEVFLERDAKLLTWEKRFIHALDRYDELIRFQPGNEEAIFDRGQVACSQGLNCQAQKSYEQLLSIDPLHNLASEALARSLLNRRPAIEASQSYWEEKGRGELSRIRRHKSIVGVTIPVFGAYNLSLAGNIWIESPKQREKNYTAHGHTLTFDGVINRYISGAISWTGKRYDMDSLGVKDTGSANLSLNLNDYLRLDLGYIRSDELYNNFGIRKGIQSDTYWTALSGNPIHNMTLSAKASYLKYNDDNEAAFAVLSAGYILSNHPRTFKISANGEYRNTRKANEYTHGTEERLIDIIHPYWTPKNYFGESLTLEWNHDLSRFFFCGGEQHYYDLKTTFGTDSESNLAARFEAEWHYEFNERWLVSLKGMIHRSREWDAIGGWLNMRYRF